MRHNPGEQDINRKMEAIKKVIDSFMIWRMRENFMRVIMEILARMESLHQT